MPHNVLGNDHRVVNHETNRDRHRTQGHQIERLSEQPHDEHRHRERQRNGGRTDGCDTSMPQKQQQNDDRQQSANEHGIAHRTHGIGNERRLIVHGLQMHPWRERRRHRLGDLRHTVADLNGVPANLPRHIDQRGRLSVAGHHAHMIFCARHHRRHIAHAQRTAHNHRRDIFRRMRFLRRDHQILLVVTRHAANCIHGNPRLDRCGKVVIRKPRSGQARRIGNHFDLADISSLNVDAPHTGHAREHGLDLIPCNVIQRRGVAPFEIVRHNRKERRRQPLHLNIETGRELTPNLLDARPNQLQRIRHIRMLVERDRHLARPTNRTRLHALHSGNNAHRFFDRAGHGEHHLTRAE